MIAALDHITEFYHRVLLESDAGKAALEYITERGFTEETLRAFKVGFSPTTPINYTKQGFLTFSEVETLVDLKHLFKNDRAKFHDRFSGRILFPVMDSTGRTKGFAARTITGDLPKYLNSAESTAYQKSRSLFGLNLAKAAIYDNNKAIICEGYTDAMAFHQVGVKMAVACGGTHATKQQLAQISRYTSNIYLAFDADEAGDSVTASTYISAKDMGLKVGKMSIPRGKDPADVLLK